MAAVRREARHFFTPKEQAALALTEAVTLIADGGVPGTVHAEVAAHFADEEPEPAGESPSGHLRRWCQRRTVSLRSSPSARLRGYT